MISQQNIHNQKTIQNSQELIEHINGYTSGDEDKLYSIMRLANILLNSGQVNNVWHETQDYIQDKEGKNTTLFYKLFLDNFELGSDLGAKIQERQNEQHIDLNFRSPILSLFNKFDGNKAINEGQTFFEWLYQNATYSSVYELNSKALFSRKYLSSIEKEQNDTTYYEALQNTANTILENVQSALKPFVIDTCQKLNNAQNFEELKTILHTYLDTEDAALVPSGLRENIAWFKPVMLGFELMLLKKELSPFPEKQNEVLDKEHFIHQIAASQSEILLTSTYRDSAIQYITSVCRECKNENKTLRMLDLFKNSYLLGGLQSIVSMEQFTQKFMENHIFNERNKINALLQEDTDSTVKVKKVKI